MNRLKMYILIRESVPAGYAVLAAAHASLAAYRAFEDSPEMQEWIGGTFYKTVCVVNDREFEQARDCPDHVLITEAALDDAPVALAFRPRRDWPKAFRYFRLYR